MNIEILTPLGWSKF
jgi:hypothetical protein